MRIFFLVVLMATWSVKAEAELFFDFEFGQISTVQVKIIDDLAKGACWTNLKEAREYAEEKFRMNGVNLSKKDPIWVDGSYDFRIDVNADRLHKDGTGPCMGYVMVRLVTYAKVNEHFHLATRYESIGGFLRPDNFNRLVIERISSFFSEYQ